MTQSVVNQWVHLLEPVLNQALAQTGDLPARDATEIVWDAGADDEAALYFHDGTERAIPRPSDPEQQRDCYSGKKTSYAQE